MMHYKKGKNVEEELTKDTIPIECLPNDFLWMHVKGGTKVSNVVDYAKKSLDSGEHRSVVWTGSGGGVTKTISCAEILKREYNVHQVTRVCFNKVEEYWDPLLDGLEQIVATRKVPCIHILVSLDEIDSTKSGYQAPKTDTTFWEESKKETRSNVPGSIRKDGKRNPNGGQQNRRRKPPRNNRQNISGEEEKSQTK